MAKSKIYTIISKFLNEEANVEDLEKLDSWVRDDNNVSIFNRFVKIEYLTALHMAEYNVEKAKEAIKHKLAERKRKRMALIYRKVGVAASILLLVSVSFFMWDRDTESPEKLNERPIVIKAGSDKAILTLGNGNQIALEKGQNYKNEKVSSNGQELVYTKGNPTGETKNPIYNYLTIPRGGEFFVELADGTKIWLNSESKLKYPVEFIKGKTRMVELVYGEAYFNVSPSSLHKGGTFQLKTKSQEINVLGTEFNIKAYNDEFQISTTLVEGSVQVKKGDVIKVLRPNQQSLISPDNDGINVIDVDVAHEISWIQGLFAFNEESLDQMMIILSRWYDVEFVFENAKHKNFVFTGILEKTESVEEILKLIAATSDGQVKFEINEKRITIK